MKKFAIICLLTNVIVTQQTEAMLRRFSMNSVRPVCPFVQTAVMTHLVRNQVNNSSGSWDVVPGEYLVIRVEEKRIGKSNIPKIVRADKGSDESDDQQIPVLRLDLQKEEERTELSKLIAGWMEKGWVTQEVVSLPNGMNVTAFKPTSVDALGNIGQELSRLFH